MMEVYIHISKIDALMRCEPVLVQVMFPSSEHVKLIINPNKYKIFVNSDRLLIQKNLSLFGRIKKLFNKKQEVCNGN